MALIKCPKCGQKVSDNFDKCIRCGYRLDSNNMDSKIEEYRNLTNSFVNNSTYEKNNKSSHKGWTILFIALVSFIVIISVITILFNSDGQANPYPSNSDDSYYQDYTDSEYADDNSDDTETYSVKDTPKDEKIIDTDGKQIWKIYITDGDFSINGKYNGSGNFIVELLDDNQNLMELLCNEIGDYIIDKSVYVPSGYYYLQIEFSDGTYEVTWTGTNGI